MGKVAKVKKREVSVHSRAARRRNASPPPKVATTTSESTEYKPWLHNAQDAGISKKKKTKTLTRQQRQRQQRGLEKADAIVGKLEKKVKDSKNRAKKVDARRADWENLNEEIEGKKKVGGEKEVKKGGGEMGVDLEQPLVIRTEDTAGGAESAEKEQTTVAEAVPVPEPELDEVL